MSVPPRRRVLSHTCEYASPWIPRSQSVHDVELFRSLSVRSSWELSSRCEYNLLPWIREDTPIHDVTVITFGWALRHQNHAQCDSADESTHHRWYLRPRWVLNTASSQSPRGRQVQSARLRVFTLAGRRQTFWGARQNFDTQASKSTRCPMESIKLLVQTDHKFLTRASIFLSLRHQCENPHWESPSIQVAISSAQIGADLLNTRTSTNHKICERFLIIVQSPCKVYSLSVVWIWKSFVPVWRNARHEDVTWSRETHVFLFPRQARKTRRFLLTHVQSHVDVIIYAACRNITRKRVTHVKSLHPSARVSVWAASPFSRTLFSCCLHVLLSTFLCSHSAIVKSMEFCEVSARVSHTCTKLCCFLYTSIDAASRHDAVTAPEGADCAQPRPPYYRPCGVLHLYSRVWSKIWSRVPGCGSLREIDLWPLTSDLFSRSSRSWPLNPVLVPWRMSIISSLEPVDLGHIDLTKGTQCLNCLA